MERGTGTGVSRRVAVAGLIGVAGASVALGAEKVEDSKAGAGVKPAGAGETKPEVKPADVKPEVKPAPPKVDPEIEKLAKLRFAVVGCGGQGRTDMKNMIALKQPIVAFCDVDEKQIASTRKSAGEAGKAAKDYGDYRKLLEDSASFDAVIIATPDHWHAPLVKAFMAAGKHVYCEKPLTHSVGEARELAALARGSKVVTQMGNQASGEAGLRRSVELIRAGALGQVREIHCWLNGGGFPHAKKRPAEADPVPAGLNWDMWCGPAPLRPYKAGLYHPFAWRGWFDFGNGQFADFVCHILNTATRSLDLVAPHKIEAWSSEVGMESYGNKNKLKMHFAARTGAKGDARGSLDAVTVHWYDGGPKPEAEITKDVAAVYKNVPDGGCLIIGEKGKIFTNPWNVSALVKLEGEERLKDVNRHEATKDIEKSMGRVRNHWWDFVNAVTTGGKPASDFEFGARLSEIGLVGVAALRVGKDVEYDAEKVEFKGVGDSAKLLKPEWRREWVG